MPLRKQDVQLNAQGGDNWYGLQLIRDCNKTTRLPINWKSDPDGVFQAGTDSLCQLEFKE